MNKLLEAVIAGTKLAKGVIGTLFASGKKGQETQTISFEELSDPGGGRGLVVISSGGVRHTFIRNSDDTQRGGKVMIGLRPIDDSGKTYSLFSLNPANCSDDISRGHKIMIGGGYHDEALVHPLADSIEAVLAVDARAFANGFKSYIGRDHVYTDEGIARLNERLLIAARASAVKLAFKSTPQSLETCPIVNYVCSRVSAAWFPAGSESCKSDEFSTQRLADALWTYRRSGTGKSYSYLTPMDSGKTYCQLPNPVHVPDDIASGHPLEFGSVNDDALLHPLLDSVEALLAVDTEVFCRAHHESLRPFEYRGDDVERFNDSLRAAARSSGVRLSFKATPQSIETCPVVHFVAGCMMDAWFPAFFPVHSDSPDERAHSVQLLTDAFRSQRSSGTGKSYSVLTPMDFARAPRLQKEL